MNISDWFSAGALLLSAVSACASWNVYKKYGRRLNEQQTQINEHILVAQGEDELKSRCAKLIISITATRLVVTNDGQAEASDVALTFPSDAIIRPNNFPMRIKSIAAGASFAIKIWRAATSLKEIEVNFSWTDGRGVRQFGKQNVSLD